MRALGRAASAAQTAMWRNEMNLLKKLFDPTAGEIKRLGKLKIRIPKSLQPVLDELLALGK